MKKRTAGCLSAIVVLMALGCKEKPAETHAPKTPPQEAAAAVTPENESSESPKAAKIVFIGQKQACDCTRERIDTSWAVLQNALEKTPEVAVARFQVDVDESEVKRFVDHEPFMVAPGIYFLSGDDMIIEMLQGEVTEDQIASTLLGT